MADQRLPDGGWRRIANLPRVRRRYHVEAGAEHLSHPIDADFILDRRQSLERVPRLEGQVHVHQPLAGVGRKAAQLDRQAALALKSPGETTKRRIGGRKKHATCS